MEALEKKSSSGYGKPPWIFRGSALYQLHLVKAEKARACIPKEFKLVEAFGYTLGGFFLASYEDSPVGVFDELVVIAGLVWNRPTSCAWATKVYVNSSEACSHGRKDVGLPSQVATFSKTITAVSRQSKSRSGFGSALRNSNDQQNVQITKIKSLDAEDTCNTSLTSPAVSSSKFNRWMGPTIRMSLPSFSGGTEFNPNLLKYSCQIECRVQPVKPLKVSREFSLTNFDEKEQQSLQDYGGGSSHLSKDNKNEIQNLSTYVMLSKPILALRFNQMKMQVEAPIVLYQCSNSLETNTVSSLP
ncbi:protein NEOXANTHIN-DEFICIENT 1 isoform X3 [Lathyrus oleraceus]|uniref:Variant 3, Protein NEOXANTHIN-DEFICIENT 1 n=2 Tax=Pisum sativum TaxID=3888 RepID=A0A9D4YME6_PEA|nr:protein NEOXANTHIN-DEFICIENT 1 isoform X3 [Pisum sativum]XP_050899288.1 protein NEOXANTHIN-DEFICIENT 1 isoform X3 [Pisum sativum]KAI5440410.1 variant 3, Protein NEOXANTHIN-DEFICIENT 1 [Pisum sativum]